MTAVKGGGMRQRFRGGVLVILCSFFSVLPVTPVHAGHGFQLASAVGAMSASVPAEPDDALRTARRRQAVQWVMLGTGTAATIAGGILSQQGFQRSNAAMWGTGIGLDVVGTVLVTIGLLAGGSE